MAKVTITITDKEDGGVHVLFNPPMSEMIATAKRLGPAETPSSFSYAERCATAILELSRKVKSALDGATEKEAKDKARILLPVYENIKGFFTKQ